MVVTIKPGTWWVGHWRPVELAPPPWDHPIERTCKSQLLLCCTTPSYTLIPASYWCKDDVQRRSVDKIIVQQDSQQCSSLSFLYLLVVLVKVLTVFQEGLHVAQQLSSKVGLQGQQLVLDLGAPRQQLLPGIAHRIDFIGLLFGHRQLVFVQHGVGLLWGERQAGAPFIEHRAVGKSSNAAIKDSSLSSLLHGSKLVLLDLCKSSHKALMCSACDTPVLYLDGTNLKISGYLVLSDLLQRCHGDADIIQVFDLAVELLPCFVNKGKNLLHLQAIFLIAQLPIVHHPVLGFGGEGHLQIGCWVGSGLVYSLTMWAYGNHQRPQSAVGSYLWTKPRLPLSCTLVRSLSLAPDLGRKEFGSRTPTAKGCPG